MTPDEMRDAIEATFRHVMEREGGRYLSAAPAGVTPMAWHEVLDVSAADLPAHLAARAEGLAMVGLFYGCDTFARLRVQDRPAAEVKAVGLGGAVRVMRRKRMFIVHALGWRVEGRAN